eukprot:scaffold3250_cov105-Cylindrotheca_fusiformis.AAC.4
MQQPIRVKDFIKVQYSLSTILLLQTFLSGFVDGHFFLPSEFLVAAKSFRQINLGESVCTQQTQGVLGVWIDVRGGSLEPRDEEISSMVILDNPKPEIDFSISPYAFTLFQENDGSEADPDRIPRRYLQMQNQRRDDAKRAVEATLKWRKENGIDTILARPHSKFDVCKKIFPHYFCGRDDSGHIILLQRPGLIDLSIGASENGISGEDLLYRTLGLQPFAVCNGATGSHFLVCSC